MGVSFALQPLISWGKFSDTQFIGGWVEQRVHLEKILKNSELSVASTEMQAPHLRWSLSSVTKGYKE